MSTPGAPPRRIPLGAALLVVVAIGLVAAVVVLVAGGDGEGGGPEPVVSPGRQARPEAGEEVIGAWRGAATDNRDGSTVNVALRIDSLDGFSDGRLTESGTSWRCGGSLSLSRRDGNTMVFDYVEEDYPSTCLSESTVSVHATAAGGLGFLDESTASDGTAISISGDLSPSG
jgi:hypothetical protein